MIEDTTGLVSTMHKSQSISKWRIVTRRIARAGDGDGQCPECERPRVSFWCQNCESLRLRAKFPFWTSGNENIDHFLQGTQFFAGRHVKYMEFIPFSSFKNVKYLSKGGSGTVHSATWIEGPRWKAAPVWERISGRYYKRCGSTPVALKTLKNSATMSSDFFQELRRHQNMLFPYWITKIVYCFGISQDPITQNYILVTDFASDGNLFDYLQQEKSKISWSQKLTILGQVASALVDIHRKDLVHTDLHTGNILVGMSLSGAQVSIGDLGSCRPITSTSNSHDVYGVLPYVAPEVLKEISCSSASDIYSFGIIMWEVSAGQKPFADRSHDYDLALEICNGLRPEVVAGTPRRYFSLMERCWDAEPAKRPSAAELVSTLLGSKDANGFGASRDIDDQKWLDMLQKAKDAVIKYHPGAVYTSRLLDCPITRTHNVKKDK